MMTTQKYNIGSRVRVIGNTASHNIPMGKELTITGWNGSCYQVKGFSQWLYEADVELVERNIESLQKEIAGCGKAIDSKRKEIREYENRIELLKEQIEYLRTTGKECVDDNEYRIFKAVCLFENYELSSNEKAKRLASLFKRF